MLKGFMYFVILTFCVILVWIGLTVYQNFSTPQSNSEIVVVPIQGSFDFEVVDSLKNRTVVPADFNQVRTTTPSASLQTQSIESSPSALQETFPIATESGSLPTGITN